VQRRTIFQHVAIACAPQFSSYLRKSFFTAIHWFCGSKYLPVERSLHKRCYCVAGILRSSFCRIGSITVVMDTQRFCCTGSNRKLKQHAIEELAT
jgi:hypothetical protein